VALGLAAAACTSPAHPAASTVPRVLGQPSGATDVIGQPAPAGTGQLGAVDCADAEHCVAVGVAGPNNPTTTAPGAAAEGPIVIITTANGGQTWTARRVPLAPAPALSGVACPRISTCMAVGSTGSYPPAGVVLTSRNGGHSWQQMAAPANAVAVTSVECGAIASCTVLVNDGTTTWSASTTDFGHTWTHEGDLPPGFEEGRDLSCPTGLTCLVAGNTPTTTGHGQGAVVISLDGGTTWVASHVPAGVGLLQSATCASGIVCLAVGTTSTTVSDIVPARGELLVSNDGGENWTISPHTPSVDDIYGIACPLVRTCAMVGTRWVGQPATVGSGAVAVSGDAGSTFAATSTAYTPLTLTALTCPTELSCLAVGGNTVARITLHVAPAPAPLVTPRRSTPNNSI
jgi:hypothetical protein